MGQSQLTETGEEIRTTGARVIDRFRLDGKVALITGASKNIGFETARAFAEAGATVIMNARSPELLEERAESIRAESGGEVVTKVADVSDGDAASELSAFALDAFGRVDILMNNAYASGDTIGVEVLDIEDGAWESTLNTNIVAPFRLIKGLAPSMIRSGSGSIINVLSGSGFLPTPGTLPYGVSKAGLWMLTRYLSQELAPEIRVNGVCPGFTVSDTGGTVDERVAQALLPLVPMGRPGLPEEVAGAAVYLASDAASFTTGTVVFVNGGRAW